MTQQYQNIKPFDSMLRFSLALLIIAYAFATSNYYLLLIALILFVTAYKNFCIVYYLFNINKKFSLENFYLTLLPKNNPSPVLIFDREKNVLFKNDAAKHSIVCNHSDLNISDTMHQEIIENNKLETIIFECEERTFQVQLQGVKKEQFLLAYFTEITEVVELNDAIEATQREVIYAMGEIGESRSKETGNHVKRVAKYSKLLAMLYGLPEKEADMLKIASPMHDIGKVGIPDAILNAPRRLSENEFEIMKTHAQLGHDMLKNSNKPILKAAAIVAGEHHEKWDGSGYPNGKAGKEIHIYGRITAIADVFDALGSERVYKKAWKLERILEFFTEQSGKHFEPKLVDLLLNHLDRFLEIRDAHQDIKKS